MATKRKRLPKEITTLLNYGNIEKLKEQLLRCDPNAITNKYGSNIFSLSPLPREFAFWAKEYGADINFKDYYGKTPIFNHASVWDGDVQLLIELGASVDVANDFGVTPLHCAATHGRTIAVKALLAAGVDVNVKSGRIDWPGFLTPLESVLRQSHLLYEEIGEICVILLDHGAEITERAHEYLLNLDQRFQETSCQIKDPIFLRCQTEGLEKLYKILGVQK